ncbi:MAG TPA: four-helix bundle copper-binding protein [Burkholderiales bacterium]|nr:four-helix bundle copper-binding protein [Burkholderiales bacterium]
MPDASSDADLQRCIVDCLECYSLCRQEAASRRLDPAQFRLMDDCATICRTAADFMLSGSGYSARVCAVCAEICQACAQGCADIGGMQACARACRGCAESCRRTARR